MVQGNYKRVEDPKLNKEIKSLIPSMWSMRKDFKTIYGFAPVRLREILSNKMLKNLIAGIFSDSPSIQLQWQRHLNMVFPDAYKQAIKTSLDVVIEDHRLKDRTGESVAVENQTEEQMDPNSPSMQRLMIFKELQEAAKKTGTEE
ncbi:MAG: hypothetical protein ABIG61_07245 [Planctomycetota bacterium]